MMPLKGRSLLIDNQQGVWLEPPATTMHKLQRNDTASAKKP